MKKTTALVKGAMKTVFETDKVGTWLQEYSSEIAGAGSRKKKIANRAETNTAVAAAIFQFLEGYHVPTHFNRKVNATEISVKETVAIPIQIQVWNIASGSLSSRFDVAGGTELASPVIEYYLVDDKKRDRMINEYHAQALNLATTDEMKGLTRLVLKINAVLKSYFLRRGLILADFLLEFGRYRNNLVLTGDITPETIQVLDRETQKPFGPDSFGDDLKAVAKEYEAFAARVVEE